MPLAWVFSIVVLCLPPLVNPVRLCLALFVNIQSGGQWGGDDAPCGVLGARHGQEVPRPRHQGEGRRCKGQLLDITTYQNRIS